jgi:hypothetical protein
MRIWEMTAIAILALGLGGCTRHEPAPMAQDGRDADTATENAARKAGKAAHNAADKTAEAARKAGRELREAARAAREGWNEADRQDKSK